MTIGEQYKVKPEADGHINAWFGPLPYTKVAEKIGTYLGQNKNTNLPVLDFGQLGPMQFTCDIPEQYLEKI